MASWKCPKCGNEEFEKDQFQATGGNFSKIFDVLSILIEASQCQWSKK